MGKPRGTPKRNGATTSLPDNSHAISGPLSEEVLLIISQQVEKAVATAVTTAMKSILEEFEALKAENRRLSDRVRELEVDCHLKVDDLEQYGRRHSLRIFGIPERENEDTDQLALKVFNETLKVPVKLEDVNRSHRVGRRQPPLPGQTRPKDRPIIIRLCSYRTRRMIFEAKRNLKGTGIVIREDLTTERLKILNAAADRFGHRQVWSQDGRIKIAVNQGGAKRVHTVERMTDLLKITAEISSSTIGDVVHAVINGTDGCIFSFSHAKLDKSQTMLGNSEGCGLIATAITWLYKGVSEHRQRTKARFGIRVSALELTNRRRDLLASYASVSGEEIDCDSITEVRAGSFQQAAACLDAALKHRQHTDSHLVVTLHLYRHSETGPASRSRLHLIDLGGGVNVEQKLGRTEMILPPSAVGNILLAILNGHKHLPHRDQIVTQTLKQCLGSLRCQAVIIAHISTANIHQTDTIATVQLASRIHRLRRRRFKVSHPSQADDPERSPVETVDPSSSEQSADTVIYVGPGETETDGEHPPIYMSRLLPGSPQRSISKYSSRSTKSSPCKSKSKPLLDGGEEQWVDGPKISKSRLVEARNQLLAKDKRGGQKEMWVDGPSSNLMDFSKRSMIRKWVENQTMQTQSRRRDKEKGKYKEMTVFKTCEDRGRASGQEDSAEEEQPVTATATETPAAQRNAEIGKVVPIQRLQAIGQDMPEPEKPNIDNHELELDNGDELDEKSDTSSDQKEVMLDIDEDIITDEDDEIIIVEEPTELVPMQDCCLQVTEEDIALSMGEYIENPLPEVDQEDHPLKLLSEENLSVMSSLGDQGRLERWQSLSDLCPPEDDTASILSEPLYYSDGVYCQNCRLNITPSRNHVHLNSLNRLSKSISLLRHPDGSSNPNLSKLDDGWNKTNEQDIDQDNKFKDEFDALSIPPLPPLQSTMISLSSAGFKCSGRTTKPFFRQMNHSGNIHDPGGRDWQCKRLQQLRQEQRHLIQQIEAANKQLNNSVKQDSMTPTWMIRKYSMHESWMGRDRAS